jgi:hypothetical protein
MQRRQHPRGRSRCVTAAAAQWPVTIANAGDLLQLNSAAVGNAEHAADASTGACYVTSAAEAVQDSEDSCKDSAAAQCFGGQQAHCAGF